MQFITGNHRHQTFFLAFKEQVSALNAVRLIDTFIDKHDLVKMGFTKAIHKSKGRDFLLVVVKKIFCATNKVGATI